MDKAQRISWAREVLALASSNLDAYAKSAETRMGSQGLGDVARDGSADAANNVLELLLTGGMPVTDEDAASRAIWEIGGWITVSHLQDQWADLGGKYAAELVRLVDAST